MSLSTSFPSLIILASVHLEMPVAVITLEPTLFKGELCYSIRGCNTNKWINN
jgi:hypothetical protein